jgi:hypothetical protein
MLTALQALPRDAELLAFEAGCENYCEREVDEVEWQGGRVYLHPGAAATTHREAKRRVAALDRRRPVALTGLDPVTAADWRRADPLATRQWTAQAQRRSSTRHRAPMRFSLDGAPGHRREPNRVRRGAWQ